MKGINQYQKISVMTADRVRLVIMLYEGIIRFNGCAAKCISEGNVEGRNHYINRSLAILTELSTSLDMEQGGEIARNLERLYDFSIAQLTLANQGNNATHIDSVNRVIGELKAGWDAISSEKEEPGAERAARTGVSCGI